MANPVGRPTKLNKELLKKFEEIVNDPSICILTDEDVCILLGIDEDTKKNWIDTEDESEDKRNFSDLLKRARVKQKVALHNEMREGSLGWQAKAWILERKFGDLNLRNISEVKQENSGKIEIVWGKEDK